ncbi:MAG TPA: phosphate transport system regulatory protein PhoU, partial [Desulfobulbus sp.]|nr:phosphate transport system regulatory protein PhoU [Desulfobulbus sp.]
MVYQLSFQREIERLKSRFMVLGGLVEDRVRKACAVILSRDPDLLAEIIGSDWEIDEMEIEIEEECLKILALHQPVARDLRLLITIIKINNELERIADIAVNIAKRVQTISKDPALDFSIDYRPMA